MVTIINRKSGPGLPVPESAWLLLGLTGMGYALGFHALWVVLGEVLGVALGWALVARPFKGYTDRYDAIHRP